MIFRRPSILQQAARLYGYTNHWKKRPNCTTISFKGIIPKGQLNFEFNTSPGRAWSVERRASMSWKTTNQRVFRDPWGEHGGRKIVKMAHMCWAIKPIQIDVRCQRLQKNIVPSIREWRASETLKTEWLIYTYAPFFCLHNEIIRHPSLLSMGEFRKLSEKNISVVSLRSAFILGSCQRQTTFPKFQLTPGHHTFISDKGMNDAWLHFLLTCWKISNSTNK